MLHFPRIPRIPRDNQTTPRQIPIRNSQNTLCQQPLEIGDPIWAGVEGSCTVFTALFQRIITSAFGVYRRLWTVAPIEGVDRRRRCALHCFPRSLARVSFANFDRLRCRFDVNSA